MTNAHPADAVTAPSADEHAGDMPIPRESVRADIARGLVDVLALPAGQVNENERAFTGDMLIELFQYLPRTVKVEIAERLAAVLIPPPTLLRSLLREPIIVAGPLIDAFKDIPDSLLIEAIGVSSAHRDAIARRLRISDFVAGALLDSEEQSIVELVLRRKDIAISSQRIDRLVARSVHEDWLRPLVLQRLELEPRHGFQMFWWLQAAERRRVLSRFAIDRGVVQNALKPAFSAVFPDPEPDEVAKRVLTLCDRRHRPRGRNGEPVSIDMVEKMLVAARAQPNPERCAATGLLAGVSPAVATRALMDEGGEPFAILCKSIGISRSAFAEVMDKATMIRKEDGLGPTFDKAQQEELVGVFDMIARDYSRTILRYWDWRRETLTAPSQPALSA